MMRTALAFVVVVVGTVIAFSLLPRGKAATTPNSPSGRYSITHTYQNRALLLDTKTGAVWHLVFGDFCQRKASPFDIRQLAIGEQCTTEEEAITGVAEFERISVEGLYRTPAQVMIDASFTRQANTELQKLNEYQKRQERELQNVNEYQKLQHEYPPVVPPLVKSRPKDH